MFWDSSVCLCVSIFMLQHCKLVEMCNLIFSVLSSERDTAENCFSVSDVNWKQHPTNKCSEQYDAHFFKTSRGEFNFVNVLFTFMAAGLRNDSELEVASPSNNVEKMEKLANSLQDFQSQLQSCSVWNVWGDFAGSRTWVCPFRIFWKVFSRRTLQITRVCLSFTVMWMGSIKAERNLRRFNYT